MHLFMFHQKTNTILLLTLVTYWFCTSGCDKESIGEVEEDLCSYVSPSGYSFPDCSNGQITENNIVYNSDGSRRAWDFTVICSQSGKTYSGKVFAIEYYGGTLTGYTVEVNGRTCMSSFPVDTNDTAAPNVFITTPSTNDVVFGTVSIECTVEDRSEIGKVEFYIDSTLFYTDYSAPYMYSWNTKSSGTGLHKIFTRAYDIHGNAGNALSISIAVTAWEIQRSSTSSGRFVLSFVDSLTGWGAGSFSVIRTTNGGTDWTIQVPQTSYYTINDIHFIDANKGWIVGQNGLYRKTVNGGNTWEEISQHLSGYHFSIYFVNENFGWTVGYGDILKSTNGGVGWFSQPNPTSSSDNLNSVFFIDTSLGWVCGRNGVILRTTNGGINWLKTVVPGQDLYSVFFVNSSIGWACGSYGVILKTTDGGASWQQQRNTGYQFDRLESIFFPNSMTGWSVGIHGVILKTEDGGLHWHSQIASYQWSLYSVQFINASLGWVAGNDGMILQTKSGGE